VAGIKSDHKRCAARLPATRRRHDGCIWQPGARAARRSSNLRRKVGCCDAHQTQRNRGRRTGSFAGLLY